jgi:hypothetical protein
MLKKNRLDLFWARFFKVFDLLLLLLLAAERLIEKHYHFLLQIQCIPPFIARCDEVTTWSMEALGVFCFLSSSF